MALSSAASLTSLSDDVLLMVLSYLDPSDFINLSMVCTRFSRISQDRTLWNPVRGLKLANCNLQRLKKCLQFMQKSTKILEIVGFAKKYAGTPKSKTECLSEKLFLDFQSKLPSLENLSLLDHYCDCERLPITCFPPSLTHLSLVGSEFTHIPNGQSYFKDISVQMPNLEVLDLSYCRWLNNHSLIALSKLSKLKVLRVRGCHKIGEVFAYSAMAIRFGFPNLEVADFRETTVGDGEVNSFHFRSKLTHLYVTTVASAREGSTVNSITDNGVMILGTVGLCPLHTLVIPGSQVTNRIFNHIIINIPTMKYLDVRNTNVTSEGISKFNVRMPDCQVVFEESSSNATSS